MEKINHEIITIRNTKSVEKPNEDFVYFDKEKKFGMILDGVSRDKENGIYPNPSPAKIATEIFADVVNKWLVKSKNISLSVIKEAVQRGNGAVRNYNDKLRHDFPAGTVGIVFGINDNYLVYGYLGDCNGAIVRGNDFGIFTVKQTNEVVKHKHKYTSKQIRYDICNHIAHPCGYGVWDGNPSALDFVQYGEIKLQQGDIVLFYSDGMEKDIDVIIEEGLIKKTISKILPVVTSEGEDDKSCLKIEV